MKVIPKEYLEIMKERNNYWNETQNCHNCGICEEALLLRSCSNLYQCSIGMNKYVYYKLGVGNFCKEVGHSNL